MKDPKNITLKKINLTPHRSMYVKSGQKNYKISEALAELVDNSIDARIPKRKLNITIDFNFKPNDIENSNITIKDDGRGMSEIEFENAAVLGNSNKLNQLGLFGVGLNASCTNLGEKHIIMSTLGDGSLRIFTMDETEWMSKDNSDWGSEYVIHNTKEKSGTTIILSKLRSVNLNKPNYFAKRIIDDFGIRYAKFIETKEVMININGVEVKPSLPLYEEDSVEEFDFLLDSNDPQTRIYGWVGLHVDKDGSPISNISGKSGFLTFRNRRLITEWDGLKVDDEIFAFKKHPTYGRLVGIVNLDCVPVESDKRGFIQEHPLYAEAAKKIKPYVEKIRKIINEKSVKKEVSGDIKGATKEIVKASNVIIHSDDFQEVLEEINPDRKDNPLEDIKLEDEEIKNIKKIKKVRGENLIPTEIEVRVSKKNDSPPGAVKPSENPSAREPRNKKQAGEAPEILEVIEDYKLPEIETNVNDNKIKIQHVYVSGIDQDQLRSWSIEKGNILLVRTNADPFRSLGGLSLTTLALYDICESYAEWYTGESEEGSDEEGLEHTRIIQTRDAMLKDMYKVLEDSEFFNTGFSPFTTRDMSKDDIGYEMVSMGTDQKPEIFRKSKELKNYKG